MTIITAHVDDELKDSLKGHLGGHSFRELLEGVDRLFDEGLMRFGEDLEVAAPDPLVTEFKELCEDRSMNYEYAMRKALNALRRREI